MDGGEDQLTAIADRLRSLDRVGVAIAADARAGVEAAARETAKAGTAPDGTAWKPTQSGKPPLAHAAGAITAVVSGVTEAAIVLVLRGIYVWHHHGTGRLPTRAILPTAKTGVPEKIREEIRTSAKRVIARVMQGGAR